MHVRVPPVYKVTEHNIEIENSEEQKEGNFEKLQNSSTRNWLKTIEIYIEKGR